MWGAPQHLPFAHKPHELAPASIFNPHLHPALQVGPAHPKLPLWGAPQHLVVRLCKASDNAAPAFLLLFCRLGLLTPSYLCGVLPNIRWFSFAKDAAGPYFQALQARLIPTQESRTLLQVRI